MAIIKNALARETIAEFLGTFFLCLTVVTMVSSTNAALTPIGAGLVLMTQVYTYGYICGGMYNPAVTLGVTVVRLVRGSKGALIRCGCFWLAQMAAALVAGSVGGTWKGSYVDDAASGFTSSSLRGTAWTTEFLYTALLVSSVLHCTAASEYNKGGNQFYGLVIGMSVAGGALAVGGYSGGVFNPAVAFSLDFSQALYWAKTAEPFTYYYIYLTADLLGGAVAAVSFLLISPDDEQVSAARTAAAEQSEEEQHLNEKA